MHSKMTVQQNEIVYAINNQEGPQERRRGVRSWAPDCLVRSVSLAAVSK